MFVMVCVCDCVCDAMPVGSCGLAGSVLFC